MSQRITRLASVGTSESPVLRRARKNRSNVELRRQETGADSGTPPDKPKVYIPCPSCRGPIEVPVEGELPQSLECPHCGVVTHRPASGQQRAEMVTWVTNLSGFVSGCARRLPDRSRKLARVATWDNVAAGTAVERRRHHIGVG